MNPLWNTVTYKSGILPGAYRNRFRIQGGKGSGTDKTANSIPLLYSFKDCMSMTPISTDSVIVSINTETTYQISRFEMLCAAGLSSPPPRPRRRHGPLPCCGRAAGCSCWRPGCSCLGQALPPGSPPSPASGRQSTAQRRAKREHGDDVSQEQSPVHSCSINPSLHWLLTGVNMLILQNVDIYEVKTWVRAIFLHSTSFYSDSISND